MRAGLLVRRLAAAVCCSQILWGIAARAGEVTLKDLALGAELAKSVESRAEWVANREAQKSVARTALLAEVKAMLKGRA